MLLEEAIARRRSIRRFSPQPISLLQLSQLLWAAQGITNASLKFRTVPSAGATYPLEIIVVCGRKCVEETDDGIYHYNTDSHSLTRHNYGDVRFKLAGAALDQKMISQAPVDIVICALYERTSLHYGKRGERYVHIEVGHAAQNILLQATALELGAVPIGAFYEEQVQETLSLPQDHEPLYIIPIGYPSP